jgi:hypothetical protein
VISSYVGDVLMTASKEIPTPTKIICTLPYLKLNVSRRQELRIERSGRATNQKVTVSTRQVLIGA